MIFQPGENFGVFRIGDAGEIAAHTEPGPAGIEIDEQHSDGARWTRRENRLQEYISTLPASANGEHARRHVLILIYLSSGKLWRVNFGTREAFSSTQRRRDRRDKRREEKSERRRAIPYLAQR